ncbi:AcrR family transcriptional regulator [Kibdelosporangium banguiense]|uniref:AcrR family transcriptional regulator n=1 Tax=Kibdelosporangium banguiense TaxID=1365924 RepID=A0ABS4TUJ9_9PSEU|nr:TetR/AcrR family transcriptional regulator [Kibdelosporangium banguiense]MBP2327620.1 AcrR family transcriptional regulator [Kibdelosporangium banguiense]
MFSETRRPGKGPRQAAEIYRATLDLVVRHGYDGLTIEGVAACAGVNKTTIYRWWPSKDELLCTAFVETDLLKVDVTDTGSLRGDLIAVTHQVIDLLTGEEGSRVTRASLGGLDRPGLAKFVATLCAERLKAERPIFERAVARGEIAPGADPATTVDLLAGAIWYRVLVRQTELPTDFAEQLVDIVLGGLPRSS